MRIGIDLGGTKIEVIALANDGQVLSVNGLVLHAMIIKKPYRLLLT